MRVMTMNLDCTENNVGYPHNLQEKKKNNENLRFKIFLWFLLLWVILVYKSIVFKIKSFSISLDTKVD